MTLHNRLIDLHNTFGDVMMMSQRLLTDYHIMLKDKKMPENDDLQFLLKGNRNYLVYLNEMVSNLNAANAEIEQLLGESDE